MTGKGDDFYSPEEGAKRRDEVIRRMANTPPRPQKSKSDLPRQKKRKSAGKGRKGRGTLAFMPVLFLAADERFVGLNCLPFTANSTGRWAQLAHAFANTMSHEPRRLIRKAQHTVKLMSRNAFLAGAHDMRREQPFRHWNM